MNSKLLKEINNQIREEFDSAYIYLALAAQAESMNLTGLANWMKIQAQEEVDHAMGFFDYLVEVGEKIVLQPISAPPKSFSSPLEIAKAALKHEQHITGRIHLLLELANKHKDHAFASFIKWYVDEQREEEANTTDLVEKVKLTGGKSHALLMLDQILAKRKYTKTSPMIE